MLSVLTMDELNKRLEAVRYVRADRISTDDTAKPREEETVAVVEEAAVTIDVDGVDSFTILCTPADKRALAAGFLYTEGIIDSMDDIAVLRECSDDPNIIRVRLAGEARPVADAGRNLLVVSSCGACESENLEDRIESLPRVGQAMKIESGLLRSVYRSLRERQSLFEVCGGTHAAALFNDGGEIVSWAEDTGRHSALDKAIGKCLLSNIPIAGLGAALTSRLSFEMVAKCARAGIELVLAVSAPTSMAIDVACLCGVTLCAFVRDTRATIFTSPARVIGVGG
jgi:FdhD protein